MCRRRICRLVLRQAPATAVVSPGVPQTFTLLAGSTATPGTSTVTFLGQVNSVNGSADLSLTVVNPINNGLDVPTWHNDIARTGLNAGETSLTPTNVTSATFGKQSTVPTDGAVDAQPLYLSGLTIGTQTHDVLYVATENDTVYALDASSGTQLYGRHPRCHRAGRRRQPTTRAAVSFPRRWESRRRR